LFSSSDIQYYSSEWRKLTIRRKRLRAVRLLFQSERLEFFAHGKTGDAKPLCGLGLVAIGHPDSLREKFSFDGLCDFGMDLIGCSVPGGLQQFLDPVLESNTAGFSTFGLLQRIASQIGADGKIARRKHQVPQSVF
jgi:hypothetical protein